MAPAPGVDAACAAGQASRMPVRAVCRRRGLVLAEARSHRELYERLAKTKNCPGCLKPLEIDRAQVSVLQPGGGWWSS